MASRYWVGGTADWDGTTGLKWSTTSGGAGGALAPTAADNVFFDANSGAVTVSVGLTVDYTALCNNLDCTGFTGTLFFQAYNGPVLSNGNLTISGSLLLSAAMTFTAGRSMTFNSTNTGNTITLNGHTVVTQPNSGNSVIFNGVGGSWIFQDTGGMGIELDAGTLDFNGKTITIYGLFTTGSSTKVLTLGSSTLLLNGGGSVGTTVWQIAGSGLTINAGTSTLKIIDASGSGMIFAGGGFTYNNIWFSRGSSTTSITISGSNTFSDFKDDGTGAHSLLFTAGTTQTVTTWHVSGIASHLITLNSTTTAVFTISAARGIISNDYLNIQHCVATGGATWYAGANSTNNQAVATAGSGWIFTVPPPAGNTTNFFLFM